MFRYEQIILEKQELDVFSNPNTHQLLERLGTVREIVLYGVVTEICVARTGRGLCAADIASGWSATQFGTWITRRRSCSSRK